MIKIKLLNYFLLFKLLINIVFVTVKGDLGYAVKSERILCEGCGHKIQDRYLKKVGDASWHENCVACSICGTLLSDSCYSRNNKLYCKMDYDR